MNENNINKHNDIIDAEFVNESENRSNKADTNDYQNISIEKINEIHYSNQDFNSAQNQRQNFQSFYYSFGNKSNLKLKKPSILTFILLLPFIIIGLLLFLLIGLVSLVIFLPKIFNIIRKKGIKGLKMDYNLLKGLFGQFRTK